MINRIINKIKKLYNKNKLKNFDFKLLQEKNFIKLNLNRSEGLKKLDELKTKYTFLNRKMSSEHETIFSAISIKNESFSNILEIGTYDGANSFLLSKLFPYSKITTIDLEETNEMFQDTYNRKNEMNNFIKERDKILDSSKNIFFKKLNSIQLINSNENYDLIWIDGAHGYPFVCIDIINSLRLIKKNGIIMCDDIFKENPYSQDKFYNSLASYETLKELEKEKIVSLNFFLKRLDLEHNFDLKRKKYICLFQKLN